MLSVFTIFARNVAVNLHDIPRIRNSVDTESRIVVRGWLWNRVAMVTGELTMFWNLMGCWRPNTVNVVNATELYSLEWLNAVFKWFKW